MCIRDRLNSNDIRGASNILLNMLYGSKEITMDEITLITDYVKELVGRDVDVICLLYTSRCV